MQRAATSLTFDDPCLVFALRRESGPFLREFRPNERFPGAPCKARFCGPAWLTVLVIETGVGLSPTENALRWLLNSPSLGNVPYRPKLILSAGFCGGLDPARKVGDVVLATEVVDPEGHVWPATWPTELPGGEWQPPLHRARVLTMPKLVGRPEEKARLGQRHHAQVVDMESATVASACARLDVPFGCVRVVSDDATMELSPQLLSLLTNSDASVVKTVLAIAGNLSLAGELRRLAKNTQHAATQLARALGELLTLTLPFSVD